VFVTADLQTEFYVQFVGMFTIYLHVKFHTPSTDDLLVITVKLETNKNVCTAEMSLLNILIKYINMSYVFSIICCHSSIQDHILSCALTSHVRTTAMLLLQIVGN
jgi:hypothetical protein